MKRWRIAALGVLALAGAAPATADGRVGVYLGFGGGYWGPGYYAPRPYYYPHYYPPPAWYPPPAYDAPPAWYPPPAYDAPPGWYPPAGPAARACYAGPYMCQLDRPVPAGAPCSCPVSGSTRVSGHAG